MQSELEHSSETLISPTHARVNVETETERITGQVKWFNNKAGFGFITVCDGEHKGKDIFVHFSAVQVHNSQYKYLVQGEYVDFSISKPDNGVHEYHAVQVSGVKGGTLMCETRHEIQREQYTKRSPVRG